jgi:ABC-2 type transport system ATP-binding protein
MNEVIQVKNLIKKYGDFTAVDNISFQVREGEIFGILGPNGAGKTTTLEMVESLKPATSGEILVDGKAVNKHPRQVKSVIGVQLQASTFFDYLNLRELIETFASLYKRKVDASGLLRDVQLEDKAKSKVRELSGGQKQRLSIAVALVNDPKVLFLDEPTTGLDPQARRNLWDLVEKINSQGKTIVLTTHYMDEAEILCDRIAVMDHAKIVALDTTENLLKRLGKETTIRFKAGKDCSARQLAGLPGVLKVSEENRIFLLTSADPQKTLTALFDKVSECGPVLDLQLRQPTLEDVFLELTGHELRE